MSENGSLGAVRVANEVIASIAALAAGEVEGVEGMDEAAARHFGDWVRRQAAHRGGRVHIEGDRSIHLEVFITVASEAKVDRIILRIAVYEIAIDRRVPTKAAINESIELAKTFSGDEAGRFVNGILGKVAATAI